MFQCAIPIRRHVANRMGREAAYNSVFSHQDRTVKRASEEMIEAGEPLIQEAIAALSRYHEAQAAGEKPEAVERLRLVAESAYQAVTEYQLYALGHQPLVRH